MAKTVGVLLMLMFAAGCGRSPSEKLALLSEEFVNTTLSYTPSLATGAGMHQYQKQKLDEMLDDISQQNLDRQRAFYAKFQSQLAELNTSKLTAEDRADLGMLQDQVALALLDLNEIHSHANSPQMYVENLGSALFSPFVLEYAPKDVRFKHIIARVQKVPLYLDQARNNINSAPDVWTNVAMDENQGNIDLVNKTIREQIPADLKDEYEKAARPALEAMDKFQKFLKTLVARNDKVDWRLGKDRYVRKFRYSLAAGVEPDIVLADAERDLTKVRKRMLDLALPLHSREWPAHRDHSDTSDEDTRVNQIVGEVLAKIAERRSTRESYMDDAKRDLDEARAFVAQKKLFTLPPRANLQVIPTPEFMRGIYSVGGFNAAPALEPQLGAFYWVTPIPEKWPQERVDSKLREYNFYKLRLLTIHEAMPGHYVQMEIANGVQPPSRRVLRSVFGNGPYIEGWGEFATQTMLDEGFLDHSPEMELTFAKEELRVIANLILDVRLHMLNMPDQEAMDLMQRWTFQEQEEANGKLQRAKLSSCQLPMYYLGWRAWIKVREEYKNKKGASYSLAAFNDTALKEGAVPMTALSGLLNR